MSTGKNTPFNVTLIATLLVLTLFTQSPQLHAAALHTPLLTKLTCHFHHAGFWHWAANAWAIAIMRPSPRHILQAYPLAVIAMYFAPTPTIGISAILYAHIGLNIHRWNLTKESWLTFIVANLLTSLIPGIAFTVHLAAFLLAILSSYIINHTSNIKHHKSYIKHHKS